MNRISAEGLGILCQSRGMLAMPMKGCRQLLERARQDDEFQKLLQAHYAQAVKGVDDTQALSWIADLRRVAVSIEQGRWTSPHLPECPKLQSYLAVPEDKPEPAPKSAPQDAPTTPRKKGKTPAAAGDTTVSASQVRPAHQSVHVYGRTAALCFERDVSRSGEPTLAIECARCVGPQTYDWHDKITLQLTHRQLPLVLAALMRWRQTLSFDHHGDHQDKRLILAIDADRVVVTVGQGAERRMVAISELDLFAVADLVLQVMLAQHPHLNSETLLQMVRATAGQTRP